MASFNADAVTNSVTNIRSAIIDGDDNIAIKYSLLKKTPELFLSKESYVINTSNCLKAMAHPLRMKILCLLSKFEQISVLDLVTCVGTFSKQHLSILRDKGLLIYNNKNQQSILPISR